MYCKKCDKYYDIGMFCPVCKSKLDHVKMSDVDYGVSTRKNAHKDWGNKICTPGNIKGNYRRDESYTGVGLARFIIDGGSVDYWKESFSESLIEIAKEMYRLHPVEWQLLGNDTIRGLRTARYVVKDKSLLTNDGFVSEKIGRNYVEKNLCANDCAELAMAICGYFGHRLDIYVVDFNFSPILSDKVVEK